MISKRIVDLLGDNLTAEHLFWYLAVGKPKRKITDFEIVRDNFRQIRGAVFFLSTGRTGTKWFYYLLKHDRSLAVFHEPHPYLAFQAKYLYEIRVHKNYPKHLVDEIALEIFKSARTYYFMYSYRADKRYVETNNHLTFFAPAIFRLLPDTKFVHVYRHPGDFIRSGLSRGWYLPGHEKNTKLITHYNSEYWSNLTQIEKIAWLWNEINSFIENFKLIVPKEQFFSLDFSNKNIENLSALIEFLNFDISNSQIKRMLNFRANSQKNKFPAYSKWKEEHKRQVRKICGNLAERYGYQL